MNYAGIETNDALNNFWNYRNYCAFYLGRLIAPAYYISHYLEGSNDRLVRIKVITKHYHSCFCLHVTSLTVKVLVSIYLSNNGWYVTLSQLWLLLSTSHCFAMGPWRQFGTNRSVVLE